MNALRRTRQPRRKARCPFDEFASSEEFMAVYGSFVVEPSAASSKEFQRWAGEGALLRLERDGLVFSSQAGTKPAGSIERLQELAEGHRVVQVVDEPQQVLKELCRLDAAGCSGSLAPYLRCTAQAPLPWAMHCHDDQFVRAFGHVARCSGKFQHPACGVPGLNCCRTLWGHADKVEYFSGVPWDLPCNCGVELCAEANTTWTESATSGQLCCVPRPGSLSSALGAGTPELPAKAECKLFPVDPQQFPQEDTLTYTSQALLELAAGLVDEDEAADACQRHAAARLTPDVAASLQCKQLVVQWRSILPWQPEPAELRVGM